MAHSTSHDIVEKNHGNPSLSGAMAAVSHAASGVQTQATRAASRTKSLVREYPLATVGVMLGSGLLLGALAHRFLSHRPSLGELLADRIGLTTARDRMRKFI